MGFKRRPQGQFAVTRELDRLYARGFPYLRLLTDDAITASKAIRDARKALEAIDPYLPVTLPRDLARRYLRGYLIVDPYQGADQVTAAISDDDAPVDRALLGQILTDKLGPSPTRTFCGETYNFRLAEVVFLFEAFLGSEVVAEVLVDHLVTARDNPAWWGNFRDRQPMAPRRLVPVLGWLRLRMAPADWRRILGPLAGGATELPGFSRDLAALIDDAVPLADVVNPAWIAMQRRDRAWLEEHLRRRGAFGYWYDPQLFYVVGADALGRQDVSVLARLPKWQQRRIIDEFGTMRGPEIERVVAALADSRSAGKAAARWLADRGAPPIAAAPAQSRAELEAELAALIAGVGGDLVARAGDPAGERQVLDRAFARYCELRAALDDPTPDAYFTHALADVADRWDADPATVDRWMATAVAAAGG
jgi:hypothetical protein